VLCQKQTGYFYPSVTTSFILSDALKLKSTTFNYWKLRGSRSQVGNDTEPYNLYQYYNSSAFTGAETNNVLLNANLKPEMNTNIEAGMDFGFFITV
jgi:hypothetical protein